MFSLPVSGMVKPFIAFISDILNQVSPDTATEDQKKLLQKWIGTAYTVAKNFGPELVLKTDNDLDDAALAEVIEICELAATKYGLELNPMSLA